jgi:Na+/proline symporter
MPVTEMIVMVAVFAAVALSFVHLLRFAGVIILHRTLRKAVDANPEAVAPLLQRLSTKDDKADDDRSSVVLIAFGIAMVAASVVIGDPAWIHYGVAAALFPLIVGTALWARAVVLRRARRHDVGE